MNGTYCTMLNTVFSQTILTSSERESMQMLIKNYVGYNTASWFMDLDCQQLICGMQWLSKDNIGLLTLVTSEPLKKKPRHTMK